MNLTQELLGFREAYLMAVAKSWNNPEFEKKLISSTGNCKNVFTIPEFTSLFEKGLDKTGTSAPKNTNGLAMDVAIVKNQNVKYDPDHAGGTNGWFGGADVLVIKIPRGIDSNEQAEALVDFCANILIRTEKSQPKKDMRSVDHVCKLFGEYKFNKSDYIELLHRDSLLSLGDGGPTQFLTFDASLMRLIAMSWENPEGNLFDTITNDLFSIGPIGKNDSLFCFRDLQFENPWAFRIKFEKDESASWVPSKKGKPGHWKNLSNHQLYLQYPLKPDANLNEGLALARYNDTGPAYPLSCV